MFKPADPSLRALPRFLETARCRQLVRSAALAGLIPLAALAGITTTESPDAAKAATATAAAPADKATRAVAAPAGSYQVRCWQQGRLLFEENHVSLPADSAKYGLKMNGTDRNGKPLYVADTSNATCLIRAIEDERAWPR